MKLLLFFIAVFINFCDGLPEDTGNITAQVTQAKTALFDLMKEKCYANSTEDYQRFLDIANNATKCIEITLNELPIFVTPLKTFKDNFQNCVDDFIEEHESCYPEEFRDWPHLNFDVLYSVIDYLYENKDQLSSSDVRSFILNCAKEVNGSQVYTELLPCLNAYKEQVYEIKAACQEMIIVEKCIMRRLNERCPSEEDTIRKLKTDLLESLMEPCAEYDVTDNPIDMFTLIAPYAPPNINPDLM